MVLGRTWPGMRRTIAIAFQNHSLSKTIAIEFEELPSLLTILRIFLTLFPDQKPNKEFMIAM